MQADFAECGARSAAYGVIGRIRRWTGVTMCVCSCQPSGEGWVSDAARVASLLIAWNIERTLKWRQWAVCVFTDASRGQGPLLEPTPTLPLAGWVA